MKAIRQTVRLHPQITDCACRDPPQGRRDTVKKTEILFFQGIDVIDQFGSAGIFEQFDQLLIACAWQHADRQMAQRRNVRFGPLVSAIAFCAFFGQRAEASSKSFT
jgi:hypothetical protein